MKNFLKKMVVGILARQVLALRKKHQIKVIGVVGSIGKTSTKLAIAQTLGKSLRVRHQDGNYNVLVSVPLVFFGQSLPSLTNPFAWLKIFVDNAKQISGDYPFDVVVVELGTDAPGDIMQFSKYLQLDIAVVTAITPEHMEFFADLKAVADEELSVAKFSNRMIYNADLVPADLRQNLDGALSYGLKSVDADLHIANVFKSAIGMEGDVKAGGDIFLHISHEAFSDAQLYSLLAAVAVGREAGLKSTQILAGLSAITPVSGRLRRLRGINGSTIIDDTYNASPEAVKAGLQTIYKLEAPQKIAILGNMNELGAMSADAHKQIGEMCDSSQLTFIATIGPDANAHLAPAAEAKGCRVKQFDTPYDAGEFLQGFIEQGALIFAKGSQNGVFAEEAVKMLLADPEDANKLVRQSDYWLKVKNKRFGRK